MTWSPSVTWLCPGPCGSCRTWPNMPAPFSRSWKATWRPPTSGSEGFRGKSPNYSSAAPSWTPNRRQCVSTPLHTRARRGARVLLLSLRRPCTRTQFFLSFFIFFNNFWTKLKELYLTNVAHCTKIQLAKLCFFFLIRKHVYIFKVIFCCSSLSFTLGSVAGAYDAVFTSCQQLFKTSYYAVVSLPKNVLQ